MRRAILVGLALLAAVAPAGTATGRPQSGREADAQKVDRYLDGLNLPELRIVHLERVLEREPGDSATARTLADLYASRLLTLGDSAQVEELNRRVDLLLRSHPEAATPSLRVMRLQGDYNRAEALASKWIDDPEDVTSRDAAREILVRITPELDEQQGRLFKDLEKERERVDELPEGSLRTLREQALARLGEVAGRALYFDAWSHYYLGLLQPAGSGTDAFRRAREGFLKLLGVEEVDQADAEMLASPGMARAALGAGLAAFAAGDEPAAKAWLDLLHREGVNPEIRDLSDYWTAWAHLHAGRPARVSELIAALGDAFGATATPGQEALAALLVRAGFGPGAQPGQRPLGLRGLRALARMKRYDRVRQLMSRYGVVAEGQDDVVLRWASARDRFESAQKSKQAGDYEAAARGFESTLAAPDAATAPDVVANARYLLAWCRYQAGDFARAAEEFARAAKDLAARRDPDAPDAAWMHAVALQRLAASEPSRAPAAVEALEAFRRDYPDHENARLVEFEVLKLKGGAITIETAESKPTADPTYGPTCLAALRHHLDRWRRERAASRSGDAERAKVERAVAAYRRLPGPAQSAAGRLECLLAEADLALADDPASPGARDPLARAEPLAASLPPDDRLALWFHRDRFQHAQAVGDAETARAEARWLGRHARGSTAEHAALIALARMADDALSGSDPASRPARLAEALDAYGQLATALGDTPEAIAADRNALVANARLAAYATELGRHGEAAARYDAILGAYPKDANYLRRAGLAHFQAGQFERALACWQTLVDGLPAGSERWFEAKYYQMSALAKVDRDAARPVFGQFRVLYPDLGGEAWQARFATLGDALGAR